MAKYDHGGGCPCGIYKECEPGCRSYVDKRPLLIGMNNPLSDHPGHALYPHPPGCTGHHILKMIQSVDSSVTDGEYLARFDRQNMLTGENWNLQRAKARAADVWPLLRGRRAALLGKDVVRAMGLLHGAREVPPLAWQSVATYAGAQWAYVPHPSGRNHWYNVDDNRARAAAFLAEMYHHGS